MRGFDFRNISLPAAICSVNDIDKTCKHT